MKGLTGTACPPHLSPLTVRQVCIVFLPQLLFFLISACLTLGLYSITHTIFIHILSYNMSIILWEWA